MRDDDDVVNVALELESPILTCGDCRFASRVHGQWSIEDGRLVFRADADPQPGRGPDLQCCCESWRIAHWTKIVTDTGQEFSGSELRTLRKTASLAWGTT